jgi:hypothetical protein
MTRESGDSSSRNVEDIVSSNIATQPSVSESKSGDRPKNTEEEMNASMTQKSGDSSSKKVEDIVSSNIAAVSESKNGDRHVRKANALSKVNDLPSRPKNTNMTRESGDSSSEKVEDVLRSNITTQPSVRESKNGDRHVRKVNASSKEHPSFVRINKQLTEAADDRYRFETYVMELCRSEKPMSLVNIVTILHRAGRNRLTLHPIVLKRLTVLCLEFKGSEHRLRPQAVGNALYGLQRLGWTEEVRQMVAALTPKVLECLEYEGLDGQAVGNALYGLQTLEDSTEARNLVSALTKGVRECKEMLKAQHIGNALYGIHRLGDSREVRKLLAALTPKIEQCSEEMRAQAVSNALYGLHAICDSKAVRSLLDAIIPKTQECKERFRSQNVANALYGLQNMPLSDTMRKMLAALVPKVLNCSESFKAQEVGIALYGLQSQEDSPELKLLLLALVPKIRGCREKLSPQEVANGLYGLQCMGDTAEVRQLLAALSQKVQEAGPRGYFSAQEFAQAICGLRRLGDSAELRQLLAAMIPMMRACQEPLSSHQMHQAFSSVKQLGDSMELRSFLTVLVQRLQWSSYESKHISMTLSGLGSLNDSEEARQVLVALTAKLLVSTETMTARELLDACHGLRNFSPSPELRGLLVALTAKVYACTGEVQWQDVGDLRCSLQSVSETEEIEQLASALAWKIPEYQNSLLEDAWAVAAGAVESPEFQAILAATTPEYQATFMPTIPEYQATPLVQSIALEPNLPLKPEDAHNSAIETMIGSMMMKQKDEDAKITAEDQAFRAKKKEELAEAAEKKRTSMQCQETVLPLCKPADGPSVAETASSGEPSNAGAKMKFFSFRFNSIASRSPAFQNWKRSARCASSTSLDEKFDLSTSAGFSSSASSDDGSSGPREGSGLFIPREHAQSASTEAEDRESAAPESEQVDALESAALSRALISGPPSEVQARKLPAKIIRRKFGTPMPSPVQT